MRIITGIAALLLYCSNAYAQPEILWEKKHGIDGMKFWGNSSIFVNENDEIIRIGFASCGRCEWKRKIIVTKLDKSGEIIWEKILDAGNGIHPDFAYENKTGDIILINNKPLVEHYNEYFDEHYYEYYSIVKIVINGYNGSLIEVRSDSSVAKYYSDCNIGSNIISGENRYLNVSNQLQEGVEPIVYRIFDENASLVQEYQKYYPEITESGILINSVSQLSDKSLIVNAYLFEEYNVGSLIMRTDEKGNKNWLKKWAEKFHIRDMVIQNDEIFLLCFDEKKKENSLKRFDANGIETKSAVFKADSLFTKNIEPVSGGGLFVVGTNMGVDNGVILMRFNRKLEPLWQIPWRTKAKFQRLVDAKQLSNGDIIAHGYVDDAFYLARIKSSEENVSTHGMSVFPNPAEGSEIYLNINPAEQTDISIKLLSSYGADFGEIYKGAIEPGEQRLPLKIGDLPSGTYQIRISIGNKVKTESFVVVK